MCVYIDGAVLCHLTGNALSVVADIRDYDIHHPDSHDCSDLIPLLTSKPDKAMKLLVDVLDINTFMIRTEPQLAFSVGHNNLLGMALVLRKKLT